MRFLVADDHRIFFTGLKELLSKTYQDAEIAEAVTGQEVLSLVKSQHFDVILLDVRMPGVMSVSFIETLSHIDPNLRIVVLTMLDENLFGTYFLRAGAHAFVGKQLEFSRLLDAIAAVLEGKLYLGKQFHKLQKYQLVHSQPSNPFDVLSAREVEVLIQLFEGYGTKDIGERLALSPTAVSTYRTRIFQKLGTTNVFAIRDLYTIFYGER
jgi:two-component system, NarL family, invasion response regulator UvrY